MIPNNITRDDVIKAIDDIKKNGVPPGRESRIYSLQYDGALYPQKYVICVANRFRNGAELSPSDLTAAESRSYLRNLGFEVTPEAALTPYQKFMQERIREGYSMQEAAERWNEMSEGEPSEEEAAEVPLAATISLEEDLEEHITRNLNQIEPGLKLFSEKGASGRQFSMEVGRADIVAVDKDDNLVVIELKAGKANYSVIGQVLSYMGWIRQNLAESRGVRAIVIADDFDSRVKYAASEIPTLSLKRYEVSFAFKDA